MDNPRYLLITYLFTIDMNLHDCKVCILFIKYVYAKHISKISFVQHVYSKNVKIIETYHIFTNYEHVLKSC